MNKIFFKAALCMSAVAMAACEDVDDPITSVDYARAFSPSQVKANVQSRTSLRLTWEQKGDVDSYTVEVATDSVNFESTKVVSESGITESPYIKAGFDGDTKYYGRIMAINEGQISSVWMYFSFKTATEQIIIAGEDDDVTAKTVIVRWPAGSEVTHITYTAKGGEPQDYQLSDSEKAEGVAQLTGLTPETEYSIVLYKGDKVRGSMTATTLVDFGDSCPVYAGDDLIEKLNDTSYESYIIVDEAEFVIGDYTMTRPLTISGFKPSARPTISGRFNSATEGVTLTLNNVIMNGTYIATNEEGVEAQSVQGQLFEAKGAVSIPAITLNGCLIRKYQKNFIYNNAKALFGTITITNCVVDSIPGDGGDFFDFRGGELAELNVSNSTFMNGARAFLRIQVAADVKFTNCTFFRICSFDNSNNSGVVRMKNGGKISFEKCVFDQIGTPDGTTFYAAPEGSWAKTGNITAEESYLGNTYSNSTNLWADGTFYTSAPSGFSENDPKVKDAASGDLTITNIDFPQGVGDPRWAYAD